MEKGRKAWRGQEFKLDFTECTLLCRYDSGPCECFTILKALKKSKMKHMYLLKLGVST